MSHRRTHENLFTFTDYYCQVSDSIVSEVSHLTKTISERFASQLQYLELEYFTSPNFIGLFVAKEAADFLKGITAEFAKELKGLGRN